MKRVLAAALCVWGLAPRRSSAMQTNTGADAGQFLTLGAGARALGMGEAYGPVAEGAEAIYWNPAGLAQLKGPQFAYSHAELLRYFHHDFAAYAHSSALLDGTLAASYTRLSQDSLPLVSNANVNLGSFSPHSDAVAVAYAHAFAYESSDEKDRDFFRDAWDLPGATHPLRREGEPWDGAVLAGLSVKAISETIYDKSAAAFALDGGALFRPDDWRELSFSFAFHNLGTREKFIQDSEGLPAEMDLGVAYDSRSGQSRLLPALEIALPYYGNPAAKLGVEYSMTAGDKVRVAFRGGYKTLPTINLSPLAGVTSGVGLEYAKFSADFGFEPMGDLGEVYRIGIGLRW